MMGVDNKNLYRLIRDHMNAMGSSRTTVVALKAYMDAVRRLKCSETDFKDALLELNQVIKNTEPKVISLVHLIEDFEAEMEPHWADRMDVAKKNAIEILSTKLERFERDTEKVTEQCLKFVGQGDFIIVYSPPAYIRNALVRARTQLNLEFKVLVLKQEYVRTKEAIIAFQEAGVEHLLIPEFDLSHFLGAANKLFITGVSVTKDKKIVATTGTANVVGLCHLHHVPVYLFIEMVKFAHQSFPIQRIHRTEEDKVEADFTFHLTTFSHDVVDLKLIDHLICENGEITPM